MPSGVADEGIRRFETDGYLVLHGVLDARRDVEPLTRAYDALIAALAVIYDAELERPHAAASAARSPGERLAFVLGASGGDALSHLAPVLSVFSRRFRWRGDLPPAQLPELFALMRNPTLLDAVEALVGPEIYASPIYHLNMKLAHGHLALAESIAAESGRRSPSGSVQYGFEVGQTPWHMDAIAGLRDSHDSRIVIAWIPLTPADRKRGALLVVPRSHRNGVQAGPFTDDLTRHAILVEAAPGDVVLMDNTLVHGATENRSDGEVRWACNLRYLPIGEASGRPYLPGFVARSRAAPETELRNAYVWVTMWMRALANVDTRELPVPNAATTSGREAKAITRRWRERAPDVRGWLRLGPRTRLTAARRRARRLVATLRRRLVAIARAASQGRPDAES